MFMVLFKLLAIHRRNASALWVDSTVTLSECAFLNCCGAAPTSCQGNSVKPNLDWVPLPICMRLRATLTLRTSDFVSSKGNIWLRQHFHTYQGLLPNRDMTRREVRNWRRKVCQKCKDWAQEDESLDTGGLKTRSTFSSCLAENCQDPWRDKTSQYHLGRWKQSPAFPDGRTRSSWMTLAHRSFNNHYFCLLIYKQRWQ